MAWFDEFNLPGATIDGYFGFVQADGPDDDDYPDVVLANGTVTFTATTEAARIDGAWLGIQSVTAQIFEGQIVISEEDPRPVRLLATDAPIGVADWAWKASFKVDGFQLNDLTFRAPRDTTVNLTADLIPIKSQPYQIIEGASIVDAEVDTAGERMRFKMSDGTFTKWVDVPNGEKGEQGERGERGVPGIDGAAATLAMGAVTAGTTADAWMTGTPLARELNLTLPRGLKGDKGDKGGVGDRGPAGPSVKRTAPGRFALEDGADLAARLDALEYDSGWRDVSSLLGAGLQLSTSVGEARIKRVGSRVRFVFKLGVLADTTDVFTFPAGFRADRLQYLPGLYVGPGMSAGASQMSLSDRLGYVQSGALTTPASGALLAGSTVIWVGEFETSDAIPTTLPGTPA